MIVRDFRDRPVDPNSDRVRHGVVRELPLDVEADALICVHQLACTLGVSRGQIEEAGDRAEARARRAARLPYHTVVLRDQIVRVHPWTRYANHAGLLNAPSVGLGVEGHYPRDEQRRRSHHDRLSRDHSRLVEHALVLVVDELRSAGAGRIDLVTHRQASADRAADPGAEILGAVRGVCDRLGVRLQRARVWGDGAPWPDSWVTYI